jgi:hypothetical protein
MATLLLSDVWQQTYIARPLNSPSQPSLVLGAGACVYGVNNLELTRDKSTKKIFLFMVYIPNVLGTEETLFFTSSYHRH